MLIDFLATFSTNSIEPMIQELLISYIINATLKNNTSGECMIFNQLFGCQTIQAISFKSMQFYNFINFKEIEFFGFLNFEGTLIQTPKLKMSVFIFIINDPICLILFRI